MLSVSTELNIKWQSSEEEREEKCWRFFSYIDAKANQFILMLFYIAVKDLLFHVEYWYTRREYFQDRLFA